MNEKQVNAPETPLAPVEAIVDQLNADRSQVQQNIANTVKAEITAEINKDAGGNLFDSAIHATASDGTPLKTKGGMYQKKRGRKEGVKSTVGADKSFTPQIPVNEDEQRKMASNTLTVCTFQIGQFIGGENARPFTDEKTGRNEYTEIFYAWDNYLKAKNVKDIPPGVALLLGLSAYSFRVMSLEPSKNRTKSIWFGIKAKFGSFKKGKKDASYINNRNDGKRENNTGTEHSPSTNGKGD